LTIRTRENLNHRRGFVSKEKGVPRVTDSIADFTHT
jgi:hypothetical protein